MADVVVIGAGGVGCATALHLKEAAPNLDVVVVEPDFSYARAATGKGTGGVRQLFTRPENIWMSQYTLDAIDDWQTWGSVDGAPAPELNWRANGYMFVVGEQHLDTLQANFETQQRNGVAVQWLDAQDLADRFPELVSSDLAAGVLSPRDGWLNPKVFFSVLRAKTAAAGATFVTDRVVDLTQDGTVVRSVSLASGAVITAGAVINTAGVQAPELAARVGMQIPVEPMRRHEHYVETGADVDHLPFVKDVHGLAVHAFRQGISVGLVDFDHPGGEDFTIDPTDYPDRVRPALLKRFSGLGELNPRISGASSITNVTAGAYADIPLFVFHLLEYFDVDFELDIEEINARWRELAAVDQWSQMVIKETSSVVQLITSAALTGQYSYDPSGALVYRRAALDWHQLQNESEAFFLRIYGTGDYRWKGADLGVLVTKGRLQRRTATGADTLTIRAKHLIDSIRAQYAGLRLAGADAPTAPVATAASMAK